MQCYQLVSRFYSPWNDAMTHSIDAMARSTAASTRVIDPMARSIAAAARKIDDSARPWNCCSKICIFAAALNGLE